MTLLILILLILPLLLLTMPSTDQAGLSPTSPTPVSSGRPVSSLSQVNITIALLLYSQAKTFRKSMSNPPLLQPVHSGGPGPVSHSSPRYPPQYLQQVHPKHNHTFANCVLFQGGQPPSHQQPPVSGYSGGYTQQQGQYWGYQQPVE